MPPVPSSSGYLRFDDLEQDLVGTTQRKKRGRPRNIPRIKDRRGAWQVRNDGPLEAPAPPQDPIGFINSLTHTKGSAARQTFNLRPWQTRILKKLYRKRPDGLRQYRTALLMLPRKNGKSELAAAIALHGLIADGEAGAEVYSAAADRDQASLVFGVAAAMIRQNPTLDAACYIVESQKKIVHRATGSVYKAISAEAHRAHGFNASLVVYDELHAVPDRRLYDVLATSTGGRSQPLLLVISTAGYDRHSILWELYQHAKRVQENPRLDPTFLPLIFEAPVDADWTDEKVWRKANPALGDFRSLDEMRVAFKRAQAIPAQENIFRQLYLNQWTEQASRWLSLASWDACRSPRPDLEGRRCFIGMDLSATEDLTAIVAVFPDDAGGFDVLPHFFVPGDRIADRVRLDRVPYDRWADDGCLTIVPGPTIGDYRQVRDQVNAWRSQFDVQMVAIDPWNATTLVAQLTREDGCPLVTTPQTFAGLSAATKSLEKHVLSKTLRHDGHPVLRWNIQNVSVEKDPAGNLKPSKRASTERIDGVAALIMAIDAMDRTVQPPAYELFTVG